jgi:hypothetical protein
MCKQCVKIHIAGCVTAVFCVHVEGVENELEHDKSSPLCHARHRETDIMPLQRKCLFPVAVDHTATEKKGQRQRRREP